MALIIEISTEIDASIPTLCIYVNLKKAFDTVRSLESLERNSGISYNQMETYLRRKQCVRIEKTESDFL